MGLPSTAATMTMESPRRTTTAPWACLASLPVSRLRTRSPMGNSTRVGCTCTVPLAFRRVHRRVERGRDGDTRTEPAVGSSLPHARFRIEDRDGGRPSFPQAELLDDREVAVALGG